MNDKRLSLMNELVNEVTREAMDFDKIKILLDELNIPYSSDPIQLLNNVLKGIHPEAPKHEPQI
ncbi:MAG: hypothetical protein A2Z20_07990 [Bdellovibrionales bacterium RBG_16_40_8]|nr:MAG: hypothetical protein A2Z20_07990 [Bdellovibrionales bacterium RBG_16_40_8]